MYKIELRRLAQRALDKLPPREFSAVLETVKDLADTPRPRGVEKIKSAGLWVIRNAVEHFVVELFTASMTTKNSLLLSASATEKKYTGRYKPKIII